MAERSRHDQIGVEALFFAIAPNWAASEPFEILAEHCASTPCARKPVADVGELPPRLLQGIGVDDFHHVHAQARLRRSGSASATARRASRLSFQQTKKIPRQLEAAGAGEATSNESRTAEAHQKITDLGLPWDGLNSISGIESGDEEVGAGALRRRYIRTPVRKSSARATEGPGP